MLFPKISATISSPVHIHNVQTKGLQQKVNSEISVLREMAASPGQLMAFQGFIELKETLS